MDFVQVLILAVVLGAILCRRFKRRYANYPPGPSGLPFVGNLPAMIADPPKKLLEWSKIYGPTISIKFGSTPQVIMHDYDTIKTAFFSENTTGRDQDFILTKLLKGKGFLGSEGEIWRQHRRFALTALRDLGMGKSWLEDAILDEVQEVIDLYSSQNGQPYNPRPHLTLSISNVICAMAFGKRYAHDDETFLRLSGMFGKNAELIAVGIPAAIFPVLQFIPGKISRGFKQLKIQIKEIHAFISQLVDQHNSSAATKKDGTDYISLYMTEMEKQQKDPKSTMNLEELTASVLSLFAAGTDTSTVTLLWAMIYMIENPDVFAKVHAEIDAKIGRDRYIRMSDKALLMYTDAVLLEVQRLASIAPLAVAHTSLEPIKIDGFDIPARTVLMANVYAAHRDPKYWEKPLEFSPEHFLTADGTVVIPKGFMPFGVGKRACLGESLAKMNIFLFFTNIVKKFDIQRAPGSEVSSEKYISPFIRTPLEFKICIMPRWCTDENTYNTS